VRFGAAVDSLERSWGSFSKIGISRKAERAAAVSDGRTQPAGCRGDRLAADLDQSAGQGGSKTPAASLGRLEVVMGTLRDMVPAKGQSIKGHDTKGHAMGQVSVTLNGRTYRLECGEGEEAHLIALSEYLASHMETMKHKFGQVGDDRLILMASLMVTDELWEARRQLQELKGNVAELRRDRSSADESSKMLRADLADTISAAADRLNS
jgi:cell division protein ZapA